MARNTVAPGLRAMRWALCFLLSLCPGGAEVSFARRVAVADDTVVGLATQVRHTTVLAVPADERILEFVLGDPDRWGLAGAANIALLKPLAAGARTSVTLVTDAGRIYAFTAEEGPGDPDLMVHVRRAVPQPGMAELPEVAYPTAPVPVSAVEFPTAPVLGPVPGPDPLLSFDVPRAVPRPSRAELPEVGPGPAPVPVDLAAFPAAPVLAPAPPARSPLPSRAAVPVLLPAWIAAPAVLAIATVPVPEPPTVPVAPPAAEPPVVPPASSSPIGEDAPLVEKAAPATTPRGTMRFEYALDAAARGAPFRVVAMWNDGERTWFRSPAAGLWDVYAAGDGFGGARVECEPVEEGLCAVRGVLGDGALRMGRLEARWKLRPVRDPR